MKYALRGITAEELNYTVNRIKMDRNTKFEIKPQFSRTIRKVQENDKLYFVALEVKVESTEAEPKPFNLKARLVGIFEAEDVNTDEDRQVLGDFHYGNRVPVSSRPWFLRLRQTRLSIR